MVHKLKYIVHKKSISYFSNDVDTNNYIYSLMMRLELFLVCSRLLSILSLDVHIAFSL